MDELEILWANLLSREPERIRATWQELDTEEQAAVHAHLKQMAFEEGWSEPQRISARAALDVLKGLVSGQ